MKSKINIQEFADTLMGKSVLVHARLDRTFSEDHSRVCHIHWTKQQMNSAFGWIVGLRWLQNGLYEPGCLGSEGEYDPPYLGVDSVTPCVLVALSPRTKPIPVPFDGFELKEGTNPPASNSFWTAENREWLRNIMREDVKKMKRDSRGRFGSSRSR